MSHSFEFCNFLAGWLLLMQLPPAQFTTLRGPHLVLTILLIEGSQDPVFYVVFANPWSRFACAHRRLRCVRSLSYCSFIYLPRPLSRKKANKLQHALNGNIFGFDAMALLRWSIGWTGVHYQTDIELTDGERARVTIERLPSFVQPSLEMSLPKHHDSLRHDIVLEAVSSGWLRRCTDCPSTAVDRYVLVVSEIDLHSYTNWQNQPYLPANFIWIVSPWLCWHRREETLEAWLAKSVIHRGVALRGRDTQAYVRPSPGWPTHPCAHDQRVDGPVSDELGHRSTGQTYRPLERNDGNRCSVCWPHSQHYANPEMLEALFDMEAEDIDYDEVNFFLLHHLRVVQAYLLSSRPSSVTIVAATEAYPIEDSFAAPRGLVIVLTDRPGHGTVRDLPLPRGPWEFLVVSIPQFGGPRSLALSRIVVASMLPYDVTVYTINSRQGGVFVPASTEFSQDVEIPQFYRSNLVAASAGVGRFKPSGMAFPARINISRMIEFAHYYGVDELVFHHEDILIWFYDYPITVEDAVRTPDWHMPNTIWLAKRGTSSAVCVPKPTRQKVARSVALLAAPPHMPVALVPDAGRYEETAVGAWSRPQEWLTSEGSNASAGSIVCVVTFGTRGDTVPIRASARWLASVGFVVFVIDAVTPEDGRRLLTVAEIGGFDANSAATWMNARTACSTLPGLVIAPKQLAAGHIRYSYEGPSWWAKPTRFSLPALIDIAYRLFLEGTEDVRVGSWRDVDCVPRSSDGVNFDTYRPGGSRSTRAVFVPGSSATSAPPTGVPVLLDTNHVEALRDVEIAYVVGLGTAQTAAAAGCRVVMTSSLVDRAVRDPLNAGAGMYFGASPSRWLSHIALVNFSYFRLVSRLMSWTDFAHLALLATSRYWRRVVFGAVTIAIGVIRLPHYIKPGPGFAQTALLSLLGRPSGAQVLFAALTTSVVTTFGPALGMDVPRVIVWVIWFALRHVDDPVTYMFFYSGYHFVVSAVLSDVLRVMAGFAFDCASATFAGYRDPQAYFSARFFWVGPLPVVHTRFLSKDKGLVAEGVFEGKTGAFVPYYWAVHTRNAEAEPPDWELQLPVAISWETIINARPAAGYYSVIHNCQTLMMGAIGPARVRLGVAYLVFLPLLAFTSIAMAFYLALAASLVFVLAVLSPVLVLSGPQAARSLSVPAEKAWFLLYTAFRPAASYAQWLLRMALAAQWVWSGSSMMEALAELTADMSVEQALEHVERRYLAAVGRPLPGVLRELAERLLRAGEPGVPPTVAPRPSDFAAMLEHRISRSMYDAVAEVLLRQPVDDPEIGPIAEMIARVLHDLSLVVPGSDLIVTDIAGFVSTMQDQYWYGEADIDAIFAEYADEQGDPPEDFVARVLRHFFFTDGSDAPPKDVDVIPEHQIEAAGELVAQLESAGADHDDALAAVAAELAGYEHMESGSSSGVDAALVMFEEYVKASDALKSVHMTLTDWAFNVRRWSVENGVVLYTPIEFLTILGLRSVQDGAKLISLVVQPLLARWDTLQVGSPARTAMAIAFASFLDVIDVRHRVTPKPAWALLLGHHKFRMSRGDAMMASFVMTKYIRPLDYEDWSSKMIELMRGPEVDVDVLLTTPPTRALFFPTQTYGIKSNEAYIEGFDVNIHETERELRRLRDTIRFGGKPAIDMAWLATKEKMDISLARYVVDRPSASVLGKAKIIEAADSLFDDYPEMYDQPRALSVKNVIAATKWKYSAGLPFLPIIKKREQLKNSAWIYAIERAASRILNSGQFPGIAFHAFPKNQLGALETYGTGAKMIRTVTAGDRITAIAYNTLAMERNKRPPPHRALVLPSFTRTEGGMADVYRALAVHPHLVSGDATAFDSTASSELVVEGPVQLWKRGVEGNWGERATTTFMRAYYQGLADGILVSLYDGTTTRKTGGGGTGSAATTPDNRDWVRIALRASWSIVTRLPASDFKEHVVLANASDDIKFSCDDMTFSLLNEWRACMLAEYGVVFNFDTTEGLSGILHLRLVEDPDLAMYAEVGVEPSAVVVRHDPARLFTLRSEYRADRMSHAYLKEYDVVATQAVGHAYLTAHSPEAYAAIALDWEEATTSFALSFFKATEVERLFDDNGTTVGATVHIIDDAPASAILKMAAKFHPSTRDAWVASSQAKARAWLRSRRLPSYRDVFYAWVKPPSQVREVQRRYWRLPLGIASPAIDALRTGLDAGTAIVRSYPSALKKLAGEPDLYTLPGRYVTTDHVYEKYIFWRACDRMGRPPTASEMSSLIRQSPFAGATDHFGFQLRLQDPAQTELLLRPSMRDKSAVTARVLASLCIYTVSDSLLRSLSQLRVLGTLLYAIFAFYVAVDTMYSFLSLTFWIGTATSSVAISNLVIRDPYLVLKIFSLTVATSVPFPWVPEGLYDWTSHVRWLADVLVVGAQVRMLVPERMHTALAAPQSPMEGAANAILRSRGPNWSLVVAGMGSGKSTLLPSFLLQSGVARVILAVPTNLLVAQYENPFVAGSAIHTWTTQSQGAFPTHGLVVMTSGLLCRLLPSHIVGRPDHISDLLGDPANTVVLVDEVGLGTTEMAQCVALACRHRFKAVAGLTGTPASHMCSEADHRFDIRVPQRFVLEIRDIVGDWVDTVSGALSGALGPGGRVLVIHPSLSEIEKLAESARSQLGVAVNVTSRERPFAPRDGHIFATTIADTGVNIDPAPSVLVDSGLSVVQVPSTVAVQDDVGVAHAPLSPARARHRLYHRCLFWSSPSIASQRAARVGRSANGVVLRHPKAGSGPEVHGRQTLSLLMQADVALYAHLTKLIGSTLPLAPVSDLPGLDRWLNFDHRRASVDSKEMLKAEAFSLWLLACDLGGAILARDDIVGNLGQSDAYRAAYRAQGLEPPSPGAYSPSWADLSLLRYVRTRSSADAPLQQGLLAFDPFEGVWLRC